MADDPAPSGALPFELTSIDAAWTSARSALLRFLLKHNVFYILSAAFMLLGCYLISLPILLRPRALGQLLVLVAILQVYELLLVAVAAFIVRRDRTSAESAWLLVIETLFLLDITFTFNACQPVSPFWGLFVAFACLAAACAKVYALEAWSRVPLFANLKPYLLITLSFVYTFQGLFAPLAASGELASAGAHLTWALLGLTPLGWEALRRRSPRKGPRWLTSRFRRGLALGILSAAGLQVLGQVWVYEFPMRAAHLFPLGLTLSFVLPALYPGVNRAGMRYMRCSLIVLGLVLPLIAGEVEAWPVGLWLHAAAESPLARLTLSSLRLNAVIAAALFFWFGRRPRTLALHDAGCALLALACFGHDGRSILAFLERPDFEKVALVACVILAYLARSCTFRRGLAAGGLWLALMSRALAAGPATGGAHFEGLRWLPLLGFALDLALQGAHRRWNWCWAWAVFALGVEACRGDAPSDWLCFYLGAAVMVAAWWLRGRQYLVLLFAYVALGNLARLRLRPPSLEDAWGWSLIALAFTLLGMAFGVTCLRLERGQDAGDSTPDTPVAAQDPAPLPPTS
ncbi:MAG: hypothetical protein M5U26_17290 [Planctomycetota bacterium]|nr:hypothetical protein [Planctomycetota bacterium]